MSDRPRAVILVGNPANPYSRAIRIGRSLVEEGYEVEIAATTQPGTPLEQHDGALLIRRYPASGLLAGIATTHSWESPTAPRPPLHRRILRAIRLRPASWIFWPHTVRGWWHTLATRLAPADLYHACGLLAIAPALAARRRDRSAGRTSRVIFDIVDIATESNNVFGMPRVVRWLLRRRERSWARAADAHATVNEALADQAMSMWSLELRPGVVPNYPELRDRPVAEGLDLIRAATGLPSTTRICLFWGRLGPYVGLDQAAEAVLHVPDTALVLLGFGRGWAASLARDRESHYAGRHFTLPAVHPDEIVSWVASADVALFMMPPLAFNERHATPNKFFEAIAAGTPIVLGPDLPVMESIVRTEDLGTVAASRDPTDAAAAIRSILDRSPEERAAWRQRIQATSRERYAWPAAAVVYRALVRAVRAA